MNTPMRLWLLLLVLTFITGCGSSPGPDSISSHGPAAAGAYPDCLACHSSAQPSFDPVLTNGEGSAGKHKAHVTNGRIPCIKCHYQYTDQASHMNGTMDTSNPAVHLVNFDPATNPTGVWTKTTNPLSGLCSSLLCHGKDIPDWYGPGGGVLFDCPTCHSYSIGTRRQILGPEGDFATNPAITSHHVSGANDPTEAQCTVCHDQSNHTSGTVRLRHADGGASIAYDPAASATLEPFCLSCHDTDGANGDFSPFADGRTIGAGSLYPVESASRYPLTNAAVITGWTNSDAAHADDNVYATASPGQNQSVESRWGNFGFDKILPTVLERGQLNSLRIRVQYRVDTQASIASLSAQAAVSGTACPTVAPVHTSEPTGDTTVTFDVTSCRTWTRENLLDSNFTVIIGARRGDSTTPVTFSLDYVNVTATYNGTSYISSTRIKDYWTRSYGHRQKGLTCIGNGNPNTGCHANGHGSSHVGILARNMTLPVAPPDRYRENDYDLCFNCHGVYSGVRKEDIFGVRFDGAYYGGYGPGFGFPPYNLSAISTRFRDQNNRVTGYPYDDGSIWIDFWLSGSNSVNLHWVHIAMDVWNYRGSVPSGVSCTACHNVHGTNNPYGMTHDEMGYLHYVEVNGDQYAQLNSISPYILNLYPTNCTYGCHKPDIPGFGQASAWFEPSNE